MERTMIPNNERPDLAQQKFIVRAIIALGYEPFRKPIHLYTLEEYKRIRQMYKEVIGWEKLSG
jgi:hypothetical protein